MKQKINARCESCGGTGLYVGMAERDGAAVVCSSCKGSGCRVLEYEPFVCRAQREGVTRVFAANPGIVIGGPDLEQFGGVAHDEWAGGKPFGIGTEDRAHTCPRWFYQSANTKMLPEWENCWESLGRSFSHCPYFDEKSKCWRRFDEENGRKS